MNAFAALPLGEHRLGYGAAGIGNLYRAVDDAEAAAIIETAWSGGVRYFDTAPHYGLGLSERRLGAVLRTKPRREFTISTKVGRLLEPVDNPAFGDAGHRRDDAGFDVPADYRRAWDYSESGVRRSLESSLERLGLDYVDVLYLHDPDVFGLERGIAEGLPALLKMRNEGLVKAIGVGANSAEALLACVQAVELDVVMLAGRYTLLEQPAARELLPACVRRDVSVVNVGVFNSGLLARQVVPQNANYNYEPAPAELLAKARALAACCADYGVELPAAALQFGLRHSAVEAVAVGAGSARQMQQNIDQMNVVIPEELWAALIERDLVPA